MWFKSLRVYRLTDELPCPAEELEQRLAGQGFRPCGGLDTSRIGWVPALDSTLAPLLAHERNDYVLICARTQQRLLPPAAVREALDERVQEIERREGRKLARRERVELKDDVVQTLLPRALTRSHLTRAVLVNSRKLLLIDAATPARAEDLLNLLRESLGTLPVKPLVPRQNPAELMTTWLAGGRLPKRLRLGQQCDLRDTLHQANVVRCRQQDLATREVRNHLEAGKQVMGLGMIWSDRLQFVLAEDLGIRGLRFEDISERDAGVEGADDELARLDANFVIMALELDRLVADLMEVFGSAD